MVKGKYSTYKPLAARRQHATTMKVILACLFGVLVLTGITGHLFSRREATTPSPQPVNPHHEALAKLIRTSEDAIGWFGNKTIDSIKNIKNLTASAVTPESPLVIKKNKFLDWLRGVVRYNDSVAVTTSATGAESTGSSDEKLSTTTSTSAEDSGERVVIAHRTPGHGFSWGPPKSDHSDVTDSPGPLHAASRSVHGMLSFLYHKSRHIAQRGKDILQSGIDKVKSTKESLGTKLFKWSKNTRELSSEHATSSTPASEAASCEGGTDNVCAVDWTTGVFTIFRNGCWVEVYNQRHDTNFSIQDSNVCINLFVHNPENYQRIENPAL